MNILYTPNLMMTFSCAMISEEAETPVTSEFQ